MSVLTNYTKIKKLFRLLLAYVGFLFLLSSCGFVGEELKQDRALNGYRQQLELVVDSVSGKTNRMESLKNIISEISKDESLITLRKKNKLLSEVYYFISNEYFEIGNMDDALESSTLAVVFDKTNQYAYYNRACIYQELGKDSLAIEDYGLAISNDDRFVDSYYNRALLYQKRSNFKLAIEDYTKAVMLQPPYLADVYNNRGSVFQQMELYENAIEDYNLALEVDSSLAIAYCNRADVYLKRGELARAKVDYEKAILLDSVGTAVSSHIKQIKETYDKVDVLNIGD